MIDALGPCGYEGVFRRASEVTLRVMREQKRSLMSVLTPFIYDPLVEFNKASSRKPHTKSTAPHQSRNMEAYETVEGIGRRVEGKAGSGLFMRVEGQVCVCACARAL